MAGHRADEATARGGLGHPIPEVRASALGALARIGAITQGDLTAGLVDPAPQVRRRTAEIAPSSLGAELAALLSDRDWAVVEMAAWALGERGEVDCVTTLATTARAHPDPLCRESAVAAIGAIASRTGYPAERLADGLAAVLDALGDRPAVRRRAVLALAPFEGTKVEAALRASLADRDWQVRQGAEDLLAGP
ncbi:MAG: HEAT repeat domain-containing protein [Candidatus Dormibacteria bacterium]